MREGRFSNLPSGQSRLLVDCAFHPPPFNFAWGGAGQGRWPSWNLAYQGAGGGAGRAGEDVLAGQFPLAQPPPSSLHSPEGVTGRKGWKEGKGN